MSFSRKIFLSCVLFAQCLIAGLAAPAQAGSTTIPQYFFQGGTTGANCAEQNGGLAAHVPSGLKFQISQGTDSSDSTYVFQAVNSDAQQWAAGWNDMKLKYRAGTKMTAVPADFSCVPGQESSSSFLAMSGYEVSAEPYYHLEHWYGVARIAGQIEHVLIFPRDTSNGGPSAVIMIQSATAKTTMQLDQNGIIISQE
jgi:hypothetical protein